MVTVFSHLFFNLVFKEEVFNPPQKGIKQDRDNRGHWTQVSKEWDGIVNVLSVEFQGPLPQDQPITKGSPALGRAWMVGSLQSTTHFF